jgi:hypothetical protein
MFSTVIGGSALGVIIFANIYRPRRRRRQLREPVDAFFVICAGFERLCDYAQQDDEEHVTKTLVLPANTEIIADLVFKPRLSFRTTDVYFGCDGPSDKKPLALEYVNSFIKIGARSRIIPGPNTAHYVDIYDYYHAVEEKGWSLGSDMSYAIKIRTRAPGIYVARAFFAGDEVEGKAELLIQVEVSPRTPMKCVKPAHRWKSCSHGITPLLSPPPRA